MNARERIPLPTVTPLTAPSGFRERLLALGVLSDDVRLDAQGHFLALLLAMNERVNLTAIVDADTAWERHTLDALSLVPDLASLPRGARIADLGSGGGVPALPLAIVRPDVSFTLVESIQKKAAFLEDVSHALGLTNVTVRASRAEELARGPEGGTFDAVTARALASLDKLVPLAAPLLRPLGRRVFIKGQRADEELAAAASALRTRRVRHLGTRPTPTGRIVTLEKLPTR